MIFPAARSGISFMDHDFILRRKQQGIDLEEINGSDVKNITSTLVLHL